MAVIDLASPDTKFDTPEVCFFCGKPLTAMTVFWSGESDLYLHPRCAHELALVLIYDAGRGTAAARGQRLDAGIAPALAAAGEDCGDIVVALHRYRRRR